MRPAGGPGVQPGMPGADRGRADLVQPLAPERRVQAAVEQPPVEGRRPGPQLAGARGQPLVRVFVKVGTRSGWRVGGCQIDLAMSARTVAKNVSASPLEENVTGAL